MSTETLNLSRIERELIVPIQASYKSLIGWGIFLIVLGTIGLIVPIAFSIGVTIFIGAIMLVTGATGIALFWKSKGWGARTATLLFAFLGALCGLLMMFYPVLGAESLTLFLSAYFIAVGLVKIWVSLSNTDTKGWGLMLFSAIVSVLLGGCLWWGWPSTAVYILGIFVGIELLFDGWTALIFGLEVRNFAKNNKGTAPVETPTPETPAAAAATTETPVASQSDTAAK